MRNDCKKVLVFRLVVRKNANQPAVREILPNMELIKIADAGAANRSLDCVWHGILRPHSGSGPHNHNSQVATARNGPNGNAEHARSRVPARRSPAARGRPSTPSPSSSARTPGSSSGWCSAPTRVAPSGSGPAANSCSAAPASSSPRGLHSWRSRRPRWRRNVSARSREHRWTRRLQRRHYP